LKRLIVTADDFGAAPEVNEAVEDAHRHGILTAASLMVGAPAARDAAERAKAMPALKVGLHLVLTEGRPVLPPDRVPALVGSDGCFPPSMAAAGAAMFFNPAARAQLAEEVAAQFEAFAATGLPLDHVNAHKHFHLHPTIAGAILKAGRAFGLKAARVPLEPGPVLAAAEPGYEPGPAYLTAPWARLLKQRFRHAGLLTPDWVFGLAWSGAMTRERLLGLVNALPEGLSEIYLHPATSGAFAGAAPGYRYGEELAALLDPEVASAVQAHHLQLGGFSDFLGRR
jgi:hopanoid biosynthesis associated protein HpnK